jgi:hypothetical protein
MTSYQELSDDEDVKVSSSRFFDGNASNQSHMNGRNNGVDSKVSAPSDGIHETMQNGLPDLESFAFNRKSRIISKQSKSSIDPEEDDVMFVSASDVSICPVLMSLSCDVDMNISAQ